MVYKMCIGTTKASLSERDLRMPTAVEVASEEHVTRLSSTRQIAVGHLR